MKILVVSLLRLGDFIMTAPVISGLKAKYPNAKIDVWVHLPTAALAPLLPIVNHWWTLDRDELQSGLGQADIPLLTSFDVLRETCDQMNAENYDLIVNLTQTRFSGYLMGYLRSKAKLGLTLESNGRTHFHSPWFRYLNDQTGRPSSDRLHFTDIFCEACEVGSERTWDFHSTAAGRAEIAPLGLSGEVVAIQPWTSDHKKNWSLASWSAALAQLARSREASTFVIFGSPSEQLQVEALIASLPQNDRTRFKPLVCSLDGALAALELSSLLITGDTSIKHLANATGVKVLEIGLGSSDYRETGIFKSGSVIIHSNIECAPCPHSSPCSQATHRCAAQVGPETVALAAEFLLRGDEGAIRSLAANSEHSVVIRQTRVLGNGFWFAEDLRGSDPADTVQTWIERSVAKFLFNGGEKGPIPTFGTEVYRLTEDIQRLGAAEPVLARLNFLESATEARRQASRKESNGFSVAAGGAGKIVDLTSLRQTQARLETQEREVEIQSKMIRTLKAHLMEKS